MICSEMLLLVEGGKTMPGRKKRQRLCFEWVTTVLYPSWPKCSTVISPRSIKERFAEEVRAETECIQDTFAVDMLLTLQ